MYKIKQRWEIVHNSDGAEGGGFMIYLVYRDGRFQSAHMSYEGANAWISAQ